jgi:hypothetical protein
MANDLILQLPFKFVSKTIIYIGINPLTNIAVNKIPEN